MAKKVTATEEAQTEHKKLTDAFSEFKEQKNIDRASMMSILEDVFRSMLKKKYDTDENFDIIINTEKGDLEAFRNRVIVEDGNVEDPSKQIAYSESIKLSDFGRRAILAARQNLMGKVTELEKDALFRKYENRVGEIVTGEVYQ